jgi:amino acid transporter
MGLTAYVGIPIFLGIYFAHRVVNWKDGWAIPSGEVDLLTGIDVVKANETPEVHADTLKKKMMGWFT